MSGKARDRGQDPDAPEEKGKVEGPRQGQPGAGEEKAPPGRGAGRRPASSPCLLDEDDPQIDPDYLGRP